jgi:hypothetical protein
MEKPSGTPSEHRAASCLSSTARFVRWPKIGRDLTTFLLGWILATGARSQQVATLNPIDSDKEPISKPVQPVPAPSLDLSKVIDLTVDYSFLARENLPNSQSAYGRIGEQCGSRGGRSVGPRLRLLCSGAPWSAASLARPIGSPAGQQDGLRCSHF